MKKLIIISIIFLSINHIQAQPDTNIFNSITTFFQQNNYEKLSNQFAQTLDLSIEDIDGTYGKEQATVLIKAFLKKNKTSSIILKHQGASNERTHYAVYALKSDKKAWSVYVLLGKDSKIIQLQIEE